MGTYPQLGYRDARSALEWLVRVFGFRVADIHEDERSGTVNHARLEWPSGGGVMLHTAPSDHQSVAHLAKAVADSGAGYPPFSIHVDTEDPDAVYDRAVRAGAAVVREIQDSPHGTRGFVAQDPEGLYWSFGTPLGS